jgi:hypothetical protein
MEEKIISVQIIAIFAEQERTIPNDAVAVIGHHILINYSCESGSGITAAWFVNAGSGGIPHAPVHRRSHQADRESGTISRISTFF